MPEYRLKPVEPDDRDIVLEMRNKDFVRANMLSQEIIKQEDHYKWFDNMLISHDKAYFLFLMDGAPVGVVGFFGLDTKTPDWSFYLGYENLPAGMGTVLCCLALDWFFSHYADKILTTVVLKTNSKSLRLHQKLGFDKGNQDDIFFLGHAAWNDAKTHIKQK